MRRMNRCESFPPATMRNVPSDAIARPPKPPLDRATGVETCTVGSADDAGDMARWASAPMAIPAPRPTAPAIAAASGHRRNALLPSTRRLRDEPLFVAAPLEPASAAAN